MTYQGKINQYVCKTCGGVITTIDRDDGTTPVVLSCRATAQCGGQMWSRGYSVDQSLAPTFEWYKPTGKVKAKNGLRDYVKRGGLLIREIKA